MKPKPFERSYFLNQTFTSFYVYAEMGDTELVRIARPFRLLLRLIAIFATLLSVSAPAAAAEALSHVGPSAGVSGGGATRKYSFSSGTSKYSRRGKAMRRLATATLSRTGAGAAEEGGEEAARFSPYSTHRRMGSPSFGHLEGDSPSSSVRGEASAFLAVDDDEDYEKGGTTLLRPRRRATGAHAAAGNDNNISRTLPVPDPKPVWIELLSPPIIDSSCLSPTDEDASLNIRCRTIILGLHGGTFPAASLALTAVVHNRVLRPAYNANRLAFGVAQRWSEVVRQVKVTTVTASGADWDGDASDNDGYSEDDVMSLMFIELPNCASFDLSQEEELIINTNVRDLVQSFVAPISGDIVVALEVEAPAEVNWRIVAFGYATAIPAALASLQPLCPTMPELQYLLLFTRSPSCSFPYVRSLSADMHRLVFPSVTGSDAGDELMHNSLMLIFIFIFQIFLVVVVKIALKCNFPTAMAMLYFPSASIAAALFLLPGIANASARLIFYADDGALIFAGLVGICFAVAIAGAVPYFARRAFVGVMLRETSEHLIDFPNAMQLLMPTEMWGPIPRVNSLLVPCAFVGARRADAMNQNFRPFAVAVVMGVVTAIEASTPVLCSVQAAAVTALMVAVPILDLARPLYRCPALSFMASATMAFSSLVAFTFFLHGVRPTFVTLAESPLTVMIVVAVFAVALRASVTILVGVIERLVVRPRVWPRGETLASLEVLIVSDSDSAAEGNESGEEEGGRDGDGAAFASTYKEGGDDDPIATIRRGKKKGRGGADDDPFVGIADRRLGDGEDDDEEGTEMLGITMGSRGSGRGGSTTRLTGAALAAAVGTEERPILLRDDDDANRRTGLGHTSGDLIADGTAMFTAPQHNNQSGDGDHLSASLLSPSDRERGRGGSAGGLSNSKATKPKGRKMGNSGDSDGSNDALGASPSMVDTARGFVSGRIRSISQFVSAKARENHRLMADDDAAYAPPNVAPKRRIRRSDLLASYLPTPEAAEQLHAALREERSSYDYRRSAEARHRREAGRIAKAGQSSGGGRGQGAGLSASLRSQSHIGLASSSSHPTTPRPSLGDLPMNAYADDDDDDDAYDDTYWEGVTGSGGFGSPKEGPRLGPVPPRDPALVRKARAVTRRLDEEAEGGAPPPRGVTFNFDTNHHPKGAAGRGGAASALSGKSARAPIANLLHGKGPLPPAIDEAKRREYEML